MFRTFLFDGNVIMGRYMRALSEAMPAVMTISYSFT